MVKLRKLKWLRQIILGVCSLLLLITFNSRILASNTLVVATEPAFAPFEMKSSDGTLEGFDIDLMNAIGKEAGLTVEFQSLPFDGMIPALQSKQIGAAISGMTITAERAQTISFSRPYFRSGLAIAVKASNNDIKSLDDLKDKKVAVQIGTTGAKKAAEIPGIEIVTFDSAALSLQELNNGNVEAVINDLPVTLYALKQEGLQGIKIAGEILTEEYYGIALPKDSANVSVINEALGRLIDNGSYKQIYQKWFAGDPPSLPLIAPDLENTVKVAAFNIFDVVPNLLIGSLVTLEITALSVFLGVIGGTLIALARISPYQPLRWLAQIYVDFFRGTPLLVQIFVIYFGIPALLQNLGVTFSFDRLFAGVLALGMNASAYLGEIIRGGIQSIDRGQSEAAECLGMDASQTMSYIIFPQALRRMLPPLGNEFITMIKDTSLVAVIGFEELFRRGQLAVATSYRAFEIYIAVALIYLALNIVASRVFIFLEHWTNPLERARKAIALEAN